MKKSILFIAALAILTWLPCQMMAQEKGATKLLTLKTLPDLQQVEAGDTIVMSCPKCKDAFAVSVTQTFKGVSPEEVKTMVQHLCPTCVTTIKTTGVGKHAASKLVHTCNSCGSKEVTCCLMKKGGGATPGMEEPKH
jgi:hypothetical protein